jgi:two-component system NtrC family sensor kinase
MPADRLHEAAVFQTELAELSAQADLNGLQKHLIRGTARILESDVAILVLADQQNPGWLEYKTIDSASEWAVHLQPDGCADPVSKCIRTGEVMRLEGEAAHINFDPTCTRDDLLQARSLLCAPLTTAGLTLGAILVLNRRNGCYDDLDQALITALAGVAASALQTGSLLQQARIDTASLQADRWELLESRNFLRALFDHLPASLYIIDHAYRLIAVNRGREQRLASPDGQSPGGLAGQICYQALFNRNDPCPECRVRETLLAGQITQRTERRRTTAEDLFDWEIHSYPILDDQGQVTQAILLEQDVTDRQRLEAILTQSEKLAAVGQLAAGVAHEINNPLTAIIANAQILHRELPPDSDLQESVDLIARAGARAAQVVRNLLDFARKEEYRLGLTDLNDTVGRALELVQHELVARGVIVDLDLAPSLPPILASADHLQSVWLNLLLNAIDSLDKTPGQIRVATRRTASELQISVSDNGKGIPADHLTRIFEPFYTTKAPGRGTGLGLSVSHRIVKQHGGHIRVESQLGQGSAFTVILPAS